jgi:hypothetical protein
VSWFCTDKWTALLWLFCRKLYDKICGEFWRLGQNYAVTKELELLRVEMNNEPVLLGALNENYRKRTSSEQKKTTTKSRTQKRVALGGLTQTLYLHPKPTLYSNFQTRRHNGRLDTSRKGYSTCSQYRVPMLLHFLTVFELHILPRVITFTMNLH